ncbi:hypothetical protein G5I_09435 [Acromyrmex echinatior]|uniref:Uncharacterized protein n=1 Tax=Acromyrmex echinatior TaxID=103372 RepID=F4WU78_ACREC|nr:hypothetical protein G5I_09435 [Acromyrmex echinatior]
MRQMFSKEDHPASAIRLTYGIIIGRRARRIYWQRTGEEALRAPHAAVMPQDRDSQEGIEGAKEGANQGTLLSFSVSHLKTMVKVRYAGTLQHALVQPIARMRTAWYMADLRHLDSSITCR